MDCSNCKHNYICCSNFGVTLSKTEIEQHKGKTKIVPLTEHRQLLGYVVVLQKKEDGFCVYFENNLCTIYENRPQACRNFDCEKRLG